MLAHRSDKRELDNPGPGWSGRAVVECRVDATSEFADTDLDLENLPCRAVGNSQHSEEDVLGADVIVLARQRLPQ